MLRGTAAAGDGLFVIYGIFFGVGVVIVLAVVLVVVVLLFLGPGVQYKLGVILKVPIQAPIGAGAGDAVVGEARVLLHRLHVLKLGGDQVAGVLEVVPHKGVCQPHFGFVGDLLVVALGQLDHVGDALVAQLVHSRHVDLLQVAVLPRLVVVAGADGVDVAHAQGQQDDAGGQQGGLDDVDAVDVDAQNQRQEYHCQEHHKGAGGQAQHRHTEGADVQHHLGEGGGDDDEGEGGDEGADGLDGVADLAVLLFSQQHGGHHQRQVDHRDDAHLKESLAGVLRHGDVPLRQEAPEGAEEVRQLGEQIQQINDADDRQEGEDVHALDAAEAALAQGVYPSMLQGEGVADEGEGQTHAQQRLGDGAGHVVEQGVHQPLKGVVGGDQQRQDDRQQRQGAGQTDQHLTDGFFLAVFTGEKGLDARTDVAHCGGGGDEDAGGLTVAGGLAHRQGVEAAQRQQESHHRGEEAHAAVGGGDEHRAEAHRQQTADSGQRGQLSAAPQIDAQQRHHGHHGGGIAQRHTAEQTAYHSEHADDHAAYGEGGVALAQGELIFGFPHQRLVLLLGDGGRRGMGCYRRRRGSRRVLSRVIGGRGGGNVLLFIHIAHSLSTYLMMSPG